MYLFSKNLGDVVLVLESINDRLSNARETIQMSRLGGRNGESGRGNMN